jgi:hypothetical protein
MKAASYARVIPDEEVSWFKKAASSAHLDASSMNTALYVK